MILPKWARPEPPPNPPAPWRVACPVCGAKARAARWSDDESCRDKIGRHLARTWHKARVQIAPPMTDEEMRSRATMADLSDMVAEFGRQLVENQARMAQNLLRL